ncbi:TRAP transporter large permease subunit [Leisingera methylohalidivorans]|uniref:TRAP transporter large permease subunit n=1 Tax=Leisingera methylohalidivorans TaxID=133924 RepID=UPI0012EC35BB|nr:TRAP transporter large permease subunit [Leisingera methylohalidivorans]
MQEIAMNRTGSSLAQIYDKVIAAFAAAATCWILVLMLLICADVVGLKLFASPIYGVIELTEKSIVPVVFLQLAYAARTGRITRIDFIYSAVDSKFPASARLMDALFAVVGVAILGILSSFLLADFQKAFASGSYFGTQTIFSAPVWPFTLATLIGAGALAAEFTVQCAAAVFALGSQTIRRSATLREMAIFAVSLALFGLIAAWIANAGLEGNAIGVLAIVFLFFFLLCGMPVPIVLAVVGLASIWLVRDNPAVAFRTLKVAATGTIDKFDFGVVPLFVLMGLLTNIAGIGRDAYKVAAWWTRHLLGGLGVATVVANAIFAAVTGISIASAAIFSRVAVPQMTAHGYTSRFAAGTVAGSSILGMLIPPSLLLIIFAFVTESSVGRLFVAAAVPGLLLAVLFCITIILLARFAPGWVGSSTLPDDLEKETLSSSLRLLLPIAILVLVVLGGIYLGWFTPTQAGAVGAFAALILALIRRSLTWSNFKEVLTETGQISVAVLFLIIGASVFSRALVMTSLPMDLVRSATEMQLGFWAIVCLFVGIVIVMGMFLDSTSIIVITVPLVQPLIVSLGSGVIGPEVMIWFGILTIVAVEMGLLTPPFGIAAFVVKAAIGDKVSLGDVYLGALPYLFAMLLLILILMAFPPLVTAVL